MRNYAYLALQGLISVIASIILNSIFKKKFAKEIPCIAKQIIVGIIFGGIAIFTTENGVMINGAAMNARDAAPLCAGLIFGAPSGIIAGFIGGIERWFAVYWGVGVYTRIACTIGTILAGLFGAVLRKYVFDDDVPNTVYGFVTGIVAEVMHMLLVIITHMDDTTHAFEVIRTCSLPMISINAIAVALAVFIIRKINKINRLENEKEKLSELFQKGMLFVVCIAFAITITFTGVLQSKITNKNTDELLRLNIQDIENQIDYASDKNIASICKDIAEFLDTHPYDNDLLNDISSSYKVKEINVIDNNGIILYSTNPDFIGFDMKSGEQSVEFMCLVDGKTKSYVQEYGPITMDPNIYRKYAGYVLKNGGFIQIGYDAEQFQRDIANQISGLALNRHIEETVSIIVVDANWNIVSAIDESYNGVNIAAMGLDLQSNNQKYTVYKSLFDGEELYFMYTENEGYIIIAQIPAKEADFEAIETIYLITFMEILVFAGLFVLTYFLVRKLVVLNIVKIGSSLSDITKGNLDTKVDAHDSIEFTTLSKGINDTVDKLKEYIAEANQRIDAELKYAADIQRSALPTEFPAFPSFWEVFDLYASMDPAKEVGGDFYDFFIIKKHFLVFVVADVSGKGIPASLFMMRAKTLIKTYAEGEISVEDIFTNANFNLCEGNDAGLFVTAWMGILDLTTGKVEFANAGHNPPVIKRKDGTFEYLRSKPGFVLGGMEGIVYSQLETTLTPGDQIFIYTDGVTEATNTNKELYGEDRLVKALNSLADNDAESICKGIKEDIDSFVGEADQFDDITMMSLKMHKLYKDED